MLTELMPVLVKAIITKFNNSLFVLDMFSLLQLKTKFSFLDGDEVSLPESTSNGYTILNELMVKNLSC